MRLTKSFLKMVQSLTRYMRSDQSGMELGVYINRKGSV